MSKHTQGPWEVSKHATPAYAPQFGVYAPGARNDHAIVKGDNAEADASLIAAAPDLLDALERLMQHEGELLVTPDAIEAIAQAANAIAKAKGR